MNESALNISQENEFQYYEKGEGDVLLLLHGLFGALSNFKYLIDHFSLKYKVCIPLLPLYDLPLESTSVPGLVTYLEKFIAFKKYKSVSLIGNSLGGHIALLYALNKESNIASIILTGSSGLFENSLGETYPKVSSYEYIKEKTESTFYDSKMASKDLVDEVYKIVNNREKAIRILYLAKSALRNNLKDLVGQINVPVLLVWGNQDSITPTYVAEEFHRLIPNSEMYFIDKCGHAAMMEKPKEFNLILEKFLNTLILPNNDS